MTFDSPQSMKGDFLGPLCQIWMQRIQAAKIARQSFDNVRRQCEAFYDGTAGFMWQQQHKEQYFDGKLPSPKFKITINKAFEFVAIYGPSLFWQYPNRKVASQREMDLSDELFRSQDLPPELQELVEDDARVSATQKLVNRVMQVYLNYSQREQPDTLMSHAMESIREALIGGRGLLWPETYYFPGSDQPLTQLSHGSVEDLYIDPDCRDQHLRTAGYIVRHHRNPIWQVEKIFGLPRGSLKGKGKATTSEQVVRDKANEASKPTFDAIDWYEVWSRVGVGPRVGKLTHPYLDEFDEVIGDYAYLCVADGVDYPLNAPAERFFGDDAWGKQQTIEAFEWRTANYGHPYPVWKDNRFPVAILDFNPLSRSAWPVAPLKAGLGELIAINILVSAYVDMAWENRKTYIGYLASLSQDLESALRSEDSFIPVKINDNVLRNVNEAIQILRRAESNKDILLAIEMMQGRFDKAVGLNELMYGQEGATQVRVAADIRERSAATSVRPDKMAGDVAAWMTEASRLELFLAAEHVPGGLLTPLLGRAGSAIWTAEIENVETEILMREMKTTVEASDVRRPNKERDTANIQGAQQYILPALLQLAQQTTNTEPLNEFLLSMGEAMDMDVSRWLLPPWKPPTDEQAQQIQQLMQQLEIAKLEAEVQDKQASAGQRQASAQKQMVDAAATAAKAQIDDGEIKEMEHEQELRQKEEEHRQSLIHKQEDHVQEMLLRETEALLDESLALASAGGEE